MSDTTSSSTTTTRISEMAENLVGSEIIKLAGEIKERIKAGQEIHNFTIGDFNPSLFPIPQGLEDEIVTAYREKQTNYPASNGMLELREEVARFIKQRQQLSYAPSDFLISGGARPLIHAAYQALVDNDDEVVFPVPSWNNNHYTHMAHGKKVMIETSPDTNFMPVIDQLKPHMETARLIALCSPLNPTGTVFSKEQLQAICDEVVEANKRRGPENPLYVLYDQIYWSLCYGETVHHDPVSLNEEMRPYTVYIDGLSKAFAATGIRVGWAFGPSHIVAKMKAILGHIGAWSPKAEQVATSKFLAKNEEVDTYLNWIKGELSERLESFYTGFNAMAQEGYPVEVIQPQGALYLTVKFSLKGKATAQVSTLDTTKDIASFLLNEAGLAVVPFYAFGASHDSDWFRLSVGTADKAQIVQVFDKLKKALTGLN
ncbi:MAG: pyridoxal phosphate-dependent aminotransferase [Flavobacteriales bacterium]|nr:pyridoxal phosphate-dependent aminotransferase [Flavobacteriales bacterium]